MEKPFFFSFFFYFIYNWFAEIVNKFWVPFDIFSPCQPTRGPSYKQITGLTLDSLMAVVRVGVFENRVANLSHSLIIESNKSMFLSTTCDRVQPVKFEYIISLYMVDYDTTWR